MQYKKTSTWHVLLIAGDEAFGNEASGLFYVFADLVSPEVEEIAMPTNTIRIFCALLS